MRGRAHWRRVDARHAPEREAAAAVPAIAQVLALQRGAGNHAVSRMITTDRVMVARSGRPVFSPSSGDANAIHVTWQGSERPPGAGVGGSQDDHTTAYSAFEVMIHANVEGKTLEEARSALNGLLQHAQHLPGFAEAGPGSDMMRKYTAAQQAVQQASDMVELAAAAWDILAFRQKVPLSARSTAHGGRGRENPGGLKQIETKLRRGEDPGYNERQIGVTLWAMLDLTPTNQIGDDVLLKIFQQHIVSMQMSCPRIFARFTDMKDTMVTLLGSNEALITYFWSMFSGSPGRQKKQTLIDALDGWTPPAVTEPDEDEDESESESESEEDEPRYNLRKRGVAETGGTTTKRSKTTD
jgi:hypothetical protein